MFGKVSGIVGDLLTDSPMGLNVQIQKHTRKDGVGSILEKSSGGNSEKIQKHKCQFVLLSLCALSKTKKANNIDTCKVLFSTFNAYTKKLKSKLYVRRSKTKAGTAALEYSQYATWENGCR